MRRFLVLLFTLVSAQAIADSFDMDRFMQSNGLALYDLTKLPNGQFFGNHHHVTLTAGALSFSDTWQRINQRSLTFNGVKYIGTNRGEWGGKLEVVIDGDRRELMKGNIVHLLPIGKKLYIIEGVAHLSLAYGSISVIHDVENPSTPELVTKLPDAPKLVYLDKTRPDYQRIVIVGARSVIELSPDMRLSILYWDAFWNIILAPTSIVRFQDNYYIGLPHGVAVLPAPWGETSMYCKSSSSERQNRCPKVKFYADSEFGQSISQ